jgi:hypothetical protein
MNHPNAHGPIGRQEDPQAEAGLAGPLACFAVSRLGLRLLLLLVGTTLLLAPARPALAQEMEDWPGFQLGNVTLDLTPPLGTNELNCVLPEPDGSYVAVWDTDVSTIIQRRDRGGALFWSWNPPTPLPLVSELTRAVFTTRDRVLWCSTARWFFLDREFGTVVRAGTWNLPYLDPSRVIIRNESLHVLYEGTSLVYIPNVGLAKVTYASIYNTNMEHQTVISTFMPQGWWHSFAGSWLLDFSQRTNQYIRLCTLGNNLVVGAPFNVNLPSANIPGGFVDHRVLGADTNSIFVASTVHWPQLAQTKHYFTLVDRTGTVRAQHTLTVDQIITGAAVTPDGWILSGQYFSEDSPRHVLFKLDAYGRPGWQTVVDTGGPFSYRMLNVSPPRVLKLLDETNRITLAVETRALADVPIASRLQPTVEWSANPPPMPLSPTNHFWHTPIRIVQP